MNTKIRIGGSIISELSEKIPTNIIAINELIKNSYDAGASFVTIELNTKKKMLYIKDDGSGMNRNEIDMLFHLSNSNKVHGKKNEYGRITQGSKGLGFLSVFKFGKFVEWKTNRNKGYAFSVDYDKMISSDDISKFEIELIEDDNIPNGTEISIKLDKYNVKSLNEYFSLEKNYKKIINSFDDDNFVINLTINEKTYSSKDKIPLLDNEKDQQLYYITYNNKAQKIIFKYNGFVVYSEKFSFPFTQFGLDLEIIVFHLKPHTKDKIDKLFFNPIDDLTPLIYFNTNLFNNYTIFDPNIMRNVRTTQVLNQMIGFIRIISKNPSIDFNSDRSQFLQNELTDAIKKFLYDINRKIQEIGSEKKNYLMNFDFVKTSEIPSGYIDSDDPEGYRELIKDNFAFKDKVTIDVQPDKVAFSLFGKTTTVSIAANGLSSTAENEDSNKNPMPAKINLNCENELQIPIPSSQIDLKDYIASVYNSDGVLVSKNKLAIKVNGNDNATGILSSIADPCRKVIEYSYSDPKTGVVIESIKLDFVEPIAHITTKKSSSDIFTIPAKKDYMINFSQYLDKLIEQINSLRIDKNKEIIACSLRVLFELCIDGISKCGKYPTIFDGINELDGKVVEVINYLNNHQKNGQKYVSEISNSSKIEFKSLKNILFADEFLKIIKKSHLGSHKSTMYITETEVADISRYASFFIIITNEMINNPNIT
ncbi:MAG: ATP-binding protein [Bacteroidales bacterium]|nr:ATP-binding protein [Bacteroidales bacterium]